MCSVCACMLVSACDIITRNREDRKRKKATRIDVQQWPHADAFF